VQSYALFLNWQTLSHFFLKKIAFSPFFAFLQALNPSFHHAASRQSSRREPRDIRFLTYINNVYWACRSSLLKKAPRSQHRARERRGM